MVNDNFVAHPRGQVLDQVNGTLFAAEMHLLGLYPHKRLGPSPATLVVCDHLNLVNDSDINRPVERRHLDGAAGKAAVYSLGYPLLFARDKGTRYPLGFKPRV